MSTRILLYCSILLIVLPVRVSGQETMRDPFHTAARVVTTPNLLTSKEASDAQKKASKALRYLPKAANDGSWYIVVMNSSDFWHGVSKAQKAAMTGTCYTAFYGERNMTYCNLDWVSRSSDYVVAKTLAHEYGHIICKCSDEKRANDEGFYLFRQGSNIGLN